MVYGAYPIYLIIKELHAKNFENPCMPIKNYVHNVTYAFFYKVIISNNVNHRKKSFFFFERFNQRYNLKCLQVPTFLNFACQNNRLFYWQFEFLKSKNEVNLCRKFRYNMVFQTLESSFELVNVSKRRLVRWEKDPRSLRLANTSTSNIDESKN